MLQTLYLSFTIRRYFQEVAEFAQKIKTLAKKQQTVTIWLEICYKFSGKSPSKMSSVNVFDENATKTIFLLLYGDAFKNFLDLQTKVKSLLRNSKL